MDNAANIHPVQPPLPAPLGGPAHNSSSPAVPLPLRLLMAAHAPPPFVHACLRTQVRALAQRPGHGGGAAAPPTAGVWEARLRAGLRPGPGGAGGSGSRCAQRWREAWWWFVPGHASCPFLRRDKGRGTKVRDWPCAKCETPRAPCAPLPAYRRRRGGPPGQGAPGAAVCPAECGPERAAHGGAERGSGGSGGSRQRRQRRGRAAAQPGGAAAAPAGRGCPAAGGVASAAAGSAPTGQQLWWQQQQQ